MLAVASLHAQSPAGSARVTRPANPAAAICGAGRFILTLADTPAGDETFDIVCKPDGSFTGSGRTRLTLPGAAIDVATTVEVGADGGMTAATAKGTAAGASLDQAIVVHGATATMTSNGAVQDIPWVAGVSYAGGNIFYLLPLMLARYDRSAGGAQQIPTFPATGARVEHMGRDHSSGGTYERYSLQAGPSRVVLWTDDARRVVLLAVPAQRFVARREGFEAVAPDLMAALAPAPAAPAPPDYSAPAGARFRAIEVTIPVESYVLAGTLLLPHVASARAPVPAVVLVTGSGLQDRDERIAIDGLEGYRPFRQYAEALASAGIAVLRADDRGAGGSTGRETLASATTSLLAGDARAQVSWLRARPEIDARRIAVVGHSEGAAIAAMVARDDHAIAAVVMLAGTARTGARVSVEQVMDLVARAPGMTDDLRRAQVEAQESAMRIVLGGGELPGRALTPWEREFFTYDPLVAVRALRQPLLILQGALDRQVTESHAAELAAAASGAGNRRVTVRVFPGLNHLFLPATTGAVAEYSSLASATVPHEVIEAMAGWLKRALRPARQ